MDDCISDDEHAAKLITAEVLNETIPHIGTVAALAVAERIVAALAEVEIL